jgi:protein-tyrosine-phosphatase
VSYFNGAKLRQIRNAKRLSMSSVYQMTGVSVSSISLEMTRSQAVDVEYWPIMDPSVVAGSREQILAAYRQVRDTLEKRIRVRFA